MATDQMNDAYTRIKKLNKDIKNETATLQKLEGELIDYDKKATELENQITGLEMDVNRNENQLLSNLKEELKKLEKKINSPEVLKKIEKVEEIYGLQNELENQITQYKILLLQNKDWNPRGSGGGRKPIFGFSRTHRKKHKRCTRMKSMQKKLDADPLKENE